MVSEREIHKDSRLDVVKVLILVLVEDGLGVSEVTDINTGATLS